MCPDVGDGMSMFFDFSEVDEFFEDAPFTAQQMQIMEKPVAATIINSQRRDVPVDTGATKTSIGSDIIVSTNRIVTDHIGPSTSYAPSIEYGVISKPNYPIQPFVRPSAFGAGAKAAFKVALSALLRMIKKKHG